MIRSAVLFAILAGASAATWSVCLKLGAARINVALAAMVITGSAFVVNCLVMLVMRARGHEIALRADAVSAPRPGGDRRGWRRHLRPPRVRARPAHHLVAHHRRYVDGARSDRRLPAPGRAGDVAQSIGHHSRGSGHPAVPARGRLDL